MKRGRARWPIWNYNSCERILHTLKTGYLLSRSAIEDGIDIGIDGLNPFGLQRFDDVGWVTSSKTFVMTLLV